MMLLDPAFASVRVDPFPCFSVPEVLTSALEQSLLEWFESDAPWRMAVMDFYEQYEFDFKDADVPEHLKPIFSDASLTQLRSTVGSLLGATLAPQVDVTAHKLNRSQKIRIHNDARPGGETHRFLIQINRGWSEENGGLLMLFAKDDVESLKEIIMPVSRSAFGFEISERSYHAVSKVHRGDRYTVVFSFYAYHP